MKNFLAFLIFLTYITSSAEVIYGVQRQIPCQMFADIKKQEKSMTNQAQYFFSIGSINAVLTFAYLEDFIKLDFSKFIDELLLSCKIPDNQNKNIEHVAFELMHKKRIKSILPEVTPEDYDLRTGPSSRHTNPFSYVF